MLRNASLRTPGAMHASRGTGRRMWAALFVVSLFAVSWFVPGSQITRAIVAFFAVAVLMFAVEFTAEGNHKLSNRECWCIRRAQSGGALAWRRTWMILLHVLIASFAFLALLQTRSPNGIGSSLLRLAAGVALLYAGAAAIFELSALSFQMAGYSLPLMHRSPIAARSVGEFWGHRWNRIVSAWLSAYIYWPMVRRRGAKVAILCCFFVSGAFHGWPMLTALGTSAALNTVGFFMIQSVFVLVENRLRIHTWPIALARAWTLVLLLVSSPLLIDPGLRLFGF